MHDWEKLREQVKSKLESKSIVIWGADKHTEHFLKKYLDILAVRTCVADACSEGSTLVVEGKEIPICSLNEYVCSENDYIIVSREHNPFGENYLEMNGYVVLEHYIRDEWISVFLQKKKVAFFAGNCLLLTIADCLMKQERFVEEYNCFWAPTHNYLSKYSRKTWSLVKNYCDLYVYSKHSKDNLRFFFDDEVALSAKKISVPSYYNTMFWPQLSDRMSMRANPYFVKDVGKAHGPFELADVNLNGMMERGLSTDEIVKRVSDKGFYTEETVLNNWEKSKAVLYNAEDNADIRAAEYIIDNKIIFMDSVHPSIEVDLYMAKQLMMLSGFGETELTKQGIDKFEKQYRNHTTQIPIYPSVREILGLEDEPKLYNVTYYSDREKMVTFEEYIIGYCETSKRVMELKQMYNKIL